MPSDNKEKLPRSLGVYTLTEQLGHGAYSDFYFATQSHVERGVVLESLRADSSEDVRDYFLQTVRTRGMAQLPHISQVLESRIAGDNWFLTYERPEGITLDRMIAEGDSLSTAQACALLIAAAEMYLSAEQLNIAMDSLQPHVIFIHRDASVCFLSPVLPGEAQQEQRPTLMSALAAAISPVLPRNVPGQGRVAMLVQWLTEGYEGQFLTWEAVRSAAEEIRQHTAPVLTRSSVKNLNSRSVTRQVREKVQRRRLRRNVLQIAAAAAVVVLMGVGGLLLAPSEGEQLPACEGNIIHIRSDQGPLRVYARPVSILEYQKFLAVYDDYNATNQFRRAAINKGVPAEHASHVPAEWQQQLQAIDSGKEWQGCRLTPHSPVRGISYWDALAYANFRGAVLPDEAALRVARLHGKPGDLPEEWTGTTRPADCVYEQGVIVLPATGRDWCSIEPDRAARSLQRGFRIAYPTTIQPD